MYEELNCIYCGDLVSVQIGTEQHFAKLCNCCYAEMEDDEDGLL